MRHRLISAAVTAAVALSFSAAAGARSTTNWYWTPAACKTALTNGVQIDDGRLFYPTLTFCIGTASTCAWNASHTTRLYQSFYAIMRSGDGVVRTMDFYVRGENAWRGENIRMRARYMAPAKFAIYTRLIANAAAQQQNSLGCTSGVLGP